MQQRRGTKQDERISLPSYYPSSDFKSITQNSLYSKTRARHLIIPFAILARRKTILLPLFLLKKKEGIYIFSCNTKAASSFLSSKRWNIRERKKKKRDAQGSFSLELIRRDKGQAGGYIERCSRVEFLSLSLSLRAKLLYTTTRWLLIYVYLLLAAAYFSDLSWSTTYI